MSYFFGMGAPTQSLASPALDGRSGDSIFLVRKPQWGFVYWGQGSPHLQPFKQLTLPGASAAQSLAAQPEPLSVSDTLAPGHQAPLFPARTPARPCPTLFWFNSLCPCLTHLLWSAEVRLRSDGNEAPQLCARGKEVSEPPSSVT